MKKRLSPKYIKAVVICHGKSEVIFVRNIKANLKVKIEIDAKDKGGSSIQLTSIKHFLENKGYKNSKEILGKYNYEIEHSKNQLINFKLFIIMDVDEKELSNSDIERYKNKEAFKSFDYYEHIIPIFNEKNLDEVLKKLGFEIDPKNKTESYSKIFPGNNDDYESFVKIKQKFKNLNNSNMIELFNYLEGLIHEKE